MVSCVYRSIEEGRVRVGGMGGAKKGKDEDSENSGAIYSYNSFTCSLNSFLARTEQDGVMIYTISLWDL